MLGATEVLRGGERIELEGRRQRSLLAALALYGGRPVAVDTLVDLLWGDEPPASAVPTLHVYLAGVRRALEPDRPARTPARVVVTVAPGYALRVSADALDAARFDATVDSAHQRLGAWSGTGEEAVSRPTLTAAELADVIGELDDVLRLWRGTPYADLDDAPAVVAERTRLEELRLVALEDRALARLALGAHAMVAAELEALTAEHPLRERLWLLRVLALAGSGRQADALEALRRVRHLLADELGIDPGTALRALESAVLRQDPAIIWPRATDPARPARSDSWPSEPDGASRRDAYATDPRPSQPAVAASLAVPPGDARRWPIAGRAGELAALAGLLAEAETPQFAMLVGEPGIGKTRLAQELADRARAHGFAVLIGRCSEDEGAPPMWPWVGVLRALADEVPGADLPEPDSAELTRLSELLSRGLTPEPMTAGAATPGRTAEVDAERFRVWNSVARLLAAASAVRPLLVVLDDLHWGDSSSLRLLHHLTEALGAGRIVIVGTRRTHPEPAGSLAQVAESLSRRHALRLDLTGLSTTEAAELIRSATGEEPGTEIQALRDRAEGNPFFLIELVRLLAPANRRDSADSLPAAVSDVVARRIGRLPEPTADLLRTAAVIGRQFDLPLLAAASGRAEEEALDQLDPALAAGVIAETETVDRFRFAHALIRDVVYEAIPGSRRARRHVAVANALSADPDSGQRRSELARHWLAAGPAHAARAWPAAAAAANHARELYAHEEAAVLLAAALDAQRHDPVATAADRYDLLMARAEACRLSADQDGLNDALTAAVAEADRLGDITRVARAAVGTAEGALWQIRPYGQVDENIVAVLRRVLRDLPAEDSQLRCRALLVLASELYYAEAPAYREALTEQGLAMARRLADPSLLLWACHAACIALIQPATAPQRLRLAADAVEIAVARSDQASEALARTLRAMAAGELGQVDEMWSDIRRAREIAEPLRLRHLLVVLGWLEQPWLAMRGRFDEAEQILARTLELSAAISVPQRDQAVAAGVQCLRVWQGRAAEMIPVFRGMADAEQALDVQANLQWLLVRTGRLDEARTAYEAHGLTPDNAEWLALVDHCMAAEVGFALALPGVASSAYQWLTAYRGRSCSLGFGLALGPVDAFLALAAAGAGETEVAARHAEDALNLCERWDIPLAAQWLRDQRDRGGF